MNEVMRLVATEGRHLMLLRLFSYLNEVKMMFYSALFLQDSEDKTTIVSLFKTLFTPYFQDKTTLFKTLFSPHFQNKTTLFKTLFSPHFQNKTTSVAQRYSPHFQPYYLIFKNLKFEI